jgi:hypothetical protein
VTRKKLFAKRQRRAARSKLSETTANKFRASKTPFL